MQTWQKACQACYQNAGRHTISNKLFIEESQRSSNFNEINRVIMAFAETWNKHDMNAFSELFAADAEFVNVVGLWWKGKPEIKNAHEFTHQSIFKNSRLSIEEVSTRLPVPEIAIARCLEHLRVTSLQKANRFHLAVACS